MFLKLIYSKHFPAWKTHEDEWLCPASRWHVMLNNQWGHVAALPVIIYQLSKNAHFVSRRWKVYPNAKIREKCEGRWRWTGFLGLFGYFEILLVILGWDYFSRRRFLVDLVAWSFVYTNSWFVSIADGAWFMVTISNLIDCSFCSRTCKWRKYLYQSFNDDWYATLMRSSLRQNKLYVNFLAKRKNSWTIFIYQ